MRGFLFGKAAGIEESYKRELLCFGGRTELL